MYMTQEVQLYMYMYMYSDLQLMKVPEKLMVN